MAKEKAKDKDKEAEEEKDEAKDKGEGDDKAKEGDAPESEAAEGAAEGAAPKKSKKKIIIVGVLALVVLVGGAAGAYFAGLFGKHQEKAAEGAAEGAAEKSVFYSLPEFIINLNSGTKQVSFLKATVVLELSKPEDVPQVEANLPRVMDSFNGYMRELRPSDLSGSAGIQRLREELLLRGNKALAPTKITDVLFKEVIIQ